MERAELARLLGAPLVGGSRSKQAVVVAERDPARFMRVFAEAVGSGGNVFLADPGWGGAEQAKLKEILEVPDIPSQSAQAVYDSGPSILRRGWLMIPSGGTMGGGLRFARHDQTTLSAAVVGFCAHFGLSRVNAVGVLPLYHVSGLMSWMRCALTGGRFLPCAWKEIENGRWPEREAGDWVISLVPTQLQRLLASPAAVEWLRGFRAIFLGGGPAWAELTDAAAGVHLPVSLSYGMTETAAMVAALAPANFMAGARSCGSALPHTRLSLSAEGTVNVAGSSVFRGYFPAWREEQEFRTEDLGRFDASGQLHVLGRRDAVIITGGKKVQPVEVEAALRASGEFADVAVVGVPDSEWGEVVVACYPEGGRAPDLVRAVASLATYQRPKRFVGLREWPRNAQGKVNRAVLLAAAMGE